MAYHRRKNVLEIIIESLSRAVLSFKRLGMPAKIIIICAPLLVIVGLVLILTIPKSKPVLQANAAVVSPGASVSAVTSTPAATSTQTPIPTTTTEVIVYQTLKKGDQNEKVTELQNRLMALGYLDIDEATDLYGDATETAVKWFQRQMGVDQTGVADEATQGSLYSGDAKHYTLLEDTSGTDVQSLQRQLKSLGYLSKITGYYGSETVTAVEKFQKRNNLTTDGKTGADTLELIYSPKAKPDPSVVAAIRSKANVDKMIKAAKSKLGKPYVSGAEGPNSFDCSGFVYWCLHQAGSNRGRFNAAGFSQVDDWTKISSMSGLKRGDLMFFWDSGKGKIGHVAIYIGGGTMIDASSSNGKVVQRSATKGWCKSQFRLGRRPW